jgi:hypothetical protein
MPVLACEVGKLGDGVGCEKEDFKGDWSNF